MPTRSIQDAATVPSYIQTRLEAAGLRRTLATRAVLGLFLAQPPGGLTHAQAMNALTARGLDINRVTLYRLLDRLAVCGVLQRQTDDEERTWRFSLAPEQGVGSRAAKAAGLLPFECDACHRQFELPGAGEPLRALARDLQRLAAQLGHRSERVDVAVHGTCADCTEAAA
ncbi:Fur family transcriptional regulator [Hydrogenophaga sp. BPS33]|uniref:Fur family transcriptional regulator n=1 Tax=Hydrogenophaga sp. BPS33 TaxID=2651974 RepID=UPI0013202668|nr:Fur family transcriptional regulator [Hydrogenophaga sp. BPS33]QHE87303.1 Fur family transcriptional regulator [Hydrogenophaga sp. BPS33]